jgi:hypothetical protein
MARRSGGDGNDVLIGNGGNDQLYGSGGSNTLLGGEGDDYLSVSGPGTNILDGGAGADTISGGQGDDTYLIRTGDGGSADNPDTIWENVGGGADTLRIVGIRAARLRMEVSSSGDFVRLVLPSADGTLTYADVAPAGDIGQRIERILFDDGVVWDLTNQNDAPLAADDLDRHVPFGTPTIFPAADLLANDLDINGDALHIISVSAPVNGTVALNSNGETVFTPTVGYAGPASFAYTISDGELQSTASVHLIIDPPSNQLPTAGDDLLVGGAGDDQIRGGSGADIISGGSGADSLIGGNGDDVIYGGEGDDRLDGGNSADTLVGGIGNDVLQGGNRNDHLIGDDGDDTLQGGNSNDLLFGGDGNDTLKGGNGADHLVGGAGADILTGGAGQDVFFFQSRFGGDTVNDFQMAGVQHDQLQFEKTLFADQTALFASSIDTPNGALAACRA